MLEIIGKNNGLPKWITVCSNKRKSLETFLFSDELSVSGKLVADIFSSGLFKLDSLGDSVLVNLQVCKAEKCSSISSYSSSLLLKLSSTVSLFFCKDDNSD